MFCWFTVYAIAFFVLYKLLDRLIRIPWIGNYADRYILVTGCDTGFGNLLAKRLDQRGCHVFAGCLTEKGETELKKSCSDRLHVISLDVTNRESVQKALKEVTSKLPEGKGIWGVMNNAGVLDRCGRPDWILLEDYKKPLDVNLWGLIDVTLTFLPLIKKEKGRVVNTASIAGRSTFTDLAAYCISKYGVEVFTDAMRRSLRVFGCKALMIEPGVHHTGLLAEEHMIRDTRKSFDKADPGIQQEYGEAYANFACSPKAFDRLLSNGSARVTDVVDAYEHALLGRFPRARYMVGWDAIYIYNPVNYLPEWMSDWFYELLDQDRPLPAYVKK